ncbi:MAG: hypothetical protein ACOYXT_17475 [Bacteroidota bacterium]
MNIRSNWYFPWPIKLVGIFLVLIAIGKFASSPVLSGIMVLIAVIVFTTHYGVSIQASNQTYLEYVWFMGFKSGTRKKYNIIEYLFVKPNKVSRSYNSKVQRSTMVETEYDGFIKFSDSEKIHLFNSGDRQEVVEKLVKLSKAFNVRIVDYTREVPDEI